MRRFGLVKTLARGEQIAQIRMRLRVVRCEFQRASIAGFGGVDFAARFERHAQIGVRFGEVGREVQRGAQGLLGGVVVALGEVLGGLVEEGFGSGRCGCWHVGGSSCGMVRLARGCPAAGHFFSLRRCFDG
jgi:hypothetical protein